MSKAALLIVVSATVVACLSCESPPEAAMRRAAYIQYVYEPRAKLCFALYGYSSSMSEVPCTPEVLALIPTFLKDHYP